MDYLVLGVAKYEGCFESALPKELPAFQSIYMPFDIMTWISFLLSIIVVALVFSLTDIVWNKFTNNKRGILDQASEGRN